MSAWHIAAAPLAARTVVTNARKPDMRFFSDWVGLAEEMHMCIRIETNLYRNYSARSLALVKQRSSTLRGSKESLARRVEKAFERVIRRLVVLSNKSNNLPGLGARIVIERGRSARPERPT